MTDEELIRGLRQNAWGYTVHDAANRIEQLVKERATARDAADYWRDFANARVEERLAAEAKLAKAVEALRDLRDKFGLEGGIYEVLAELEKTE
jgi:hypothetical protein